MIVWMSVRSRRALVAGIALALAAAPADAKDQAPGSQPAAKGSYSGVKLRGGVDTPPMKPPPAEGGPYITWVGFRLAAKRVSVFVQSTEKLSYKARRRGSRLRIVFAGAKVYRRNNLRPVITRRFPGPVVGFRMRRLKGHRSGSVLEIRLRRRVKPRVETSSDGKHAFTIVSFARR